MRQINLTELKPETREILTLPPKAFDIRKYERGRTKGCGRHLLFIRFRFDLR